jgi:hypothetical protein
MSPNNVTHRSPPHLPKTPSLKPVEVMFSEIPMHEVSEVGSARRGDSGGAYGTYWHHAGHER